MSNRFVERGGWWVLGQFALMLLVLVLGTTCRAAGKDSVMSAAGMGLLIIAGLCGIAGAAALGPKLTPFPKPVARAELVQRGIYRLIRHPLYLSVICAALGWSLLWRSWPAGVTAAVLALFMDAKARREEVWLRECFPGYGLYARKVRRFIPWIY